MYEKSSEEEDSLLEINIVTLGETSVGKSSLTCRFLYGKFLENYDETIEDRYEMNQTKENPKYHLYIYDTGGNGDLKKSYLETWIKNNNCFLLVYSIDDANSFKELKANCELIFQIKKNEIFSIILVGNKCDLKSERKVTEEEGKKFAKSKGILFLETSALNNYNISEVFDKVTKDYLKKPGAKINKKGSCKCC